MIAARNAYLAITGFWLWLSGDFQIHSHSLLRNELLLRLVCYAVIPLHVVARVELLII